MSQQQWTAVCEETDLLANGGVAVLHGERQLALFYVPQQQKVFALDNFDPVMRAQVMARGLVGNQGEQWYVASPLLKQRYCLHSGQGLDDQTTSLVSWPARCIDGVVEVALASADRAFSYA
ncbi:MAG TPA: nitrite reductase (NAD(P)H) small subunit [Oceanospirillaceae bacterium]|nr:nitrite reductase (NAD(P)H) small subunit [Oceanospirillaceae bacterium]